MEPDHSDFVCFLAGCGRDEYKKRFRRSSQPVSAGRTTSAGLIDTSVADKIAELCMTVTAVNPISGIVQHPRPASKGTSQSATRRGPNKSEAQSVRVGGSKALKFTANSPLSLDAFPHAVQSQEIAIKAASEKPLSSVVVTYLGFPQPNPPRSQPKDNIEPKQPDAPLTRTPDPVLSKSPVNSLSRIVESGSAERPEPSKGNPSNLMQSKKSNASLRSKDYPLSLRSVSSKAASIRHALLKRGPDAEPVDTPLPIPPVVTQVAVGSSNTPPTSQASPDRINVDVSAKEVMVALNAKDSAVAEEVAVHLISVKKAKDLVDRNKNQFDTVGGMGKRTRDEDSSTTVQYPASGANAAQCGGQVRATVEGMSKSITSLKGTFGTSGSVGQPPQNTAPIRAKISSCCSNSGKISAQNAPDVYSQQTTCFSGLVTQPPQINPPVDSMDVAYWGLVPPVKESLQDAVENAVRKAVEEIVVPPGSQKDEASEAYRTLVRYSLAEAAREADKYLQRPSLFNESRSNIRERSEGDLEFPESTATDWEPLMGGSSTDQPELVSKPNSPATLNENLKTVPPETFSEKFAENHKHGHKSSRVRNGLLSKPILEYVPIPARNSSKNGALHPKNQSTPALSFKESPKASRKAISTAADGSLLSESSIGAGDREQADEQESTARSLDDGNKDCSSTDRKSSAGRPGRRKTDHWLRELLSTNGPYEPRFTALPPRTRRQGNASTGRIRSQSAPPIKELYLGVQSSFDEAKLGDTSKTADDGDVVMPLLENGIQQTTTMTQTFAKTITDLEALLNEALFIAHQAADREDADYGPMLLGRAAAVLQGGRKGFQDDNVRKRKLDSRIRTCRWGQKRSDHVSSVPSMHESFGSFSSSDSGGSNKAEREEDSVPPRYSVPELRLKTPTAVSTELTQMSHHDAGWVPTDRLPIPLPPGWIAPSPESPAGEHGVKDPGYFKINDANPFLTEDIENARTTSKIGSTKRSRPTTGHRSQQIASCALGGLTFNLARRGFKSPSGPPPMPPIETVPSKQEVRKYIRAFHHPPIHAQASSLNLRKQTGRDQEQLEDLQRILTNHTYSWQNIDQRAIQACWQEEEIPDPARTGSLAKPDPDRDQAISFSKSYDGSQSEAIHFDIGYAHRKDSGGDRAISGGRHDTHPVELRDLPNPNLLQITQRGGKGSHAFNLQGRNHISLRGEHHKGFSFARTHKKPKIARDWAPARKRFVATVACISTALVGTLVGVYAAEVPAIQYWIVDFHHLTILGNVFFFIGLSVPTFFFWPLPLLHGRKPYTLGAMSLAMPLLFPQALAVGQFRSPYVDYWRVGLIMPRALMGFVLGFANMNFKATLLDLFGASLQCGTPHQEFVDETDVRRHGGGLGVWLGIWTWCAMGSIGIGFLIGAIIINHANPAWGFYISIAIIAFVLLLNVICPEVRRSAFRRSVAELKHEEGVSRRLGRGEVKMHMVQTGPKWWGEEFHYGVKMNAKMLRQPGFMILAIYVSWIYGQVVLLVVVRVDATSFNALTNDFQLLGSLVSNSYKFKSPYVGASVMAVPVGSLLAIPFQKASLFSRSHGHVEVDDDNAETLNRKVTFSSHIVRRAIFILVLPFAGLGYTLGSPGPPIPFIVPILFAGLIGFLSNLAMGECHGIIMETFDTSDLQPGMTGRPRGASGDKSAGKYTNYSSFPRVSSAFAITQGIGYLFAAAATGAGGVATRHIGQQAATGVMTGILLVLSFLLLGVLYRFRDVQIIPNSKQDEMQRWKNARRTWAILRAEGIEQPEWRPVVIGNPTHTMRRMCILEMGGMTRWSEIRRKNHLVDRDTLEAKHPNLAVIKDVENRIKAAEEEIIHHVRRSISRHSLSRNNSRRRKRSDGSYEQGDLGGHREMSHPSGSGNRSRKQERGKSE